MATAAGRCGGRAVWLALAWGAAVGACGGAGEGTHAADDADGGDVAAADGGDAALAGDAAVVVAPAPILGDATFFEFFRHDRVHPVTIRMSAAAWDGLVDEMVAYAAVDSHMRTGRYHRADFVFTAPDGTEEVVADVGFRTRGNTTRVVPEDADGAYHKAHFKIRFNEPFDLPEGSAAADARADRRFRTLRTLNLKWNNDDDPSHIRELYAYELLRRGGVAAPLTAPVALTLEIGGERVYFGLYLAIEDIDVAFLAKRRGPLDKGGNLYKCLWQQFGPATLEPPRDPRAIGVKDWERNYRPAYDLQTHEDRPDHAALKALMFGLRDRSGEELATWLEARFDVDGFLRWLALNVLIGMPDDYWAMGNNYYLYFPESAGLAAFIPYDYDHGFGGGWEPTPEWTYAGIATADVHAWKNLNAAWSDPATKHPLADKLLAVPRLRARYDAYLAAFIDPASGVFDGADYARVYAAQAALYAPWVVNDTGEGQALEDDGQAAWYFATKIASVRAQLGLEPLPTP